MRTWSCVPLILTAATALLSSPVAAQSDEQTKDQLRGLSFMEGRWLGGQSRGLTKSTGGFEIQRDLSRRVLVRRDRITYSLRTPKPGTIVKERPLEILVVMAPREDGKTFQANYFDSDGHVLNFVSTRVISDSLIEFVSDPVADPMRFHLTYEKVGRDGLRVAFGSADVKTPKTIVTVADGVARRAAK